MKIAAMQMVSTPSVERNLDAARAPARASRRATAPSWSSLPEYFCFMGTARPRQAGGRRGARRRADPAHARRGGARARLWLIGGTLPLRERRRRRRACCNANLRLLAATASCVARYDKIHLFALRQRPRALRRGAARCSAGAHAGRVRRRRPARRPERLLRPALSRAVPRADAGRRATCSRCPSAFTYTTGPAHWEVLLRARAIENQCYVIAPAQGGTHENGRRTLGHSMVVDPWGEVVACRATKARASSSPSSSRSGSPRVRRQLPALEHRLDF